MHGLRGLSLNGSLQTFFVNEISVRLHEIFSPINYRYARFQLPIPILRALRVPHVEQKSVTVSVCGGTEKLTRLEPMFYTPCMSASRLT